MNSKHGIFCVLLKQIDNYVLLTYFNDYYY